MKQPSERSKKLINDLEELFLLHDDDPKIVEKAVDLIRLICGSADWPVIFTVIRFLTVSNQVIVQASGDGIEHILKNIRSSFLSPLDDRMRSGQWGGPSRQWHCIKFSDLKKFTSSGEHIHLIGLISFQRDGYVRESCLQYLANIRTGVELPFLLIRLADWVPQVRQIAERAVLARMDSAYVPFFIDNLALLQKVNSKERKGCNRWKITEQIESLLLNPKNKHALLCSLLHKDNEVARICLSLLRESKTYSSADIISKICLSKDLNVRCAIFSLAQELPPVEWEATLKQLTHDRAPSIRRQALTELAEVHADNAEKLLLDGLLDKSSLVAEYARWKLSEMGAAVNFRQYYLEKLQSGQCVRNIASSLMGLVETGTADDVCTIRPFVDHAQISVKKSAIRALGKVAAADSIDLFMLMLAHDSPGVSITARKALERVLHLVQGDSLWILLTTGTKWHVQKNSLILINKMAKWDRLAYLLLAASLDSAEIRELALAGVGTWVELYRTSWQFTKPSSQTKDRLNDALLAARKNLSYAHWAFLQKCVAAN